MTRRISAVAVCCSRASVATRCKSAYDGAGGASSWGRWRGVPHSPQSFIVGRLSCWHRGHVIQDLPLAGATEGRNRGPRLPARDSRGQENTVRGCRRPGVPSTDLLNVAEWAFGERPSGLAYGGLRLRLAGDVLSVHLAAASDGPTLRDSSGDLRTSRYPLPCVRPPVDEAHFPFQPGRALPHRAVPQRISPPEHALSATVPCLSLRHGDQRAHRCRRCVRPWILLPRASGEGRRNSEPTSVSPLSPPERSWCHSLVCGCDAPDRNQRPAHNLPHMAGHLYSCSPHQRHRPITRPEHSRGHPEFRHAATHLPLCELLHAGRPFIPHCHQRVRHLCELSPPVRGHAFGARCLCSGRLAVGTLGRPRGDRGLDSRS